MEKDKKQFWKGYFWGAAFLMPGAILNLVDTFIEEDKIKDRVIETQVYHEQIEETLTQDFESLSDLRLDGYGNFTFKTEESSQLEVCKGNYKVQENLALIAGDLVCSRSLESNR